MTILNAPVVLEYIVLALEPDEVYWYVLRNGHFVALLADADGIHRSEVLPGLWLDAKALLAGDTRRVACRARSWMSYA